MENGEKAPETYTIVLSGYWHNLFNCTKALYFTTKTGARASCAPQLCKESEFTNPCILHSTAARSLIVILLDYSVIVMFYDVY